VTHSVKAKKMSRVSKNIKRGVTSSMKRKFLLPLCRSRLVQSNKWKMTKHLCLLRHKRFRKLRARYKRSGVNFTNILRTAFKSSEKLRKAPKSSEKLRKPSKTFKNTLVQKNYSLNVDEIDTRKFSSTKMTSEETTLSTTPEWMTDVGVVWSNVEFLYFLSTHNIRKSSKTICFDTVR